MHFPTDRTGHTTAFDEPIVDHWLEQKNSPNSKWIHKEGSIRRPTASQANTLQFELRPVPYVPRLYSFVFTSTSYQVRISGLSMTSNFSLMSSGHYSNNGLTSLASTPTRFKSLVSSPRSYIARTPKVSPGRVVFRASRFKSLVLSPRSYIDRTPKVSPDRVVFPAGSRFKSLVLSPRSYINRIPEVSDGQVLPPIGSNFKSLVSTPNSYIERTPKVSEGRVLLPADSRFKSLVLSPRSYIARIPEVSDGRVLLPGSSPLRNDNLRRTVKTQRVTRMRNRAYQGNDNAGVKTELHNLGNSIRDSLRKAAATVLCVPDLKTTRIDVSPLYPEAAAPKEWSLRGDDLYKHYKLTTVERNTKEFKDVDRLFHKTMPPNTAITLLERIENGALWISFCQKKEYMRNKLGYDVDERQLFHGTGCKNIEPICHQGFDFRFHGKAVGTLFGKGSYFATKANYSDAYGFGSKKMFVALVLVGDFSEGDPTYVRPPPKCQSMPQGDLFDSCVDDNVNPNIFVIFELQQAYPQYLISYS